MTNSESRHITLRFTTKQKVYLRELLSCIEQRYGTITKIECDTTDGLNLLVDFDVSPDIHFYFEKVNCWSEFPPEVFINLEKNDIFVCSINNIIEPNISPSINKKFKILEKHIIELEKKNNENLYRDINKLRNEIECIISKKCKCNNSEVDDISLKTQIEYIWARLDNQPTLDILQEVIEKQREYIDNSQNLKLLIDNNWFYKAESAINKSWEDIKNIIIEIKKHKQYIDELIQNIILHDNYHKNTNEPLSKHYTEINNHTQEITDIKERLMIYDACYNHTHEIINNNTNEINILKNIINLSNKIDEEPVFIIEKSDVDAHQNP